MIVRFAHGRRDLGRRVMDAVPRSGESVCLDGGTAMVVWGVVWQLYGGEQAAWVSLKTEREYRQALRGAPHGPAPAAQ